MATFPSFGGSGFDSGSSSQPTQPSYFGRAYQIVITPQNGGPTLTLASVPAAPILSINFSVDIRIQTVWNGQITIYNLDSATQAAISSGSGQAGINSAAQSGQPLGITSSLTMGDVVALSAGYTSGPQRTFDATANLLYTGNLLQAFSTRENVTDSKYVMRMVTNLAAVQFAFTNSSWAKGVTSWTILQQLLQNMPGTGAGGVTPIESMDDGVQQALQQYKYMSGKGVFDRPMSALAQLMKQHGVYWWISNNGLNLRLFSQAPTAAKYVYSPPNLSSYSSGGTSQGIIKPTLIGVPEGTQDGALFRVMMDNQVNIGDSVQITAGTAINAYQFNYLDLPPLPNAQNIYFVIGVRHFGETRGRADDWYTELTCVTPKFFQNQRAAFGF